ncbi:CBS domain-containing protein [Blastococcus aggregatus]|uniref:CBS domain-containing protein n=1 Tax=Blastococcus aggregatus TaxID=38502 RepID=UPI0011446D07|nr:CBS domain-containing protein [Blastococcus aggregatus]
MQARDVMSREVVTVGPDTSAKYAAEIMADRGFAAIPVVDGDDQLVGIVAEADVLAERLPPDPRLHVRRDRSDHDVPPPLLVRGVMTVGVRTVDATADVSDIARLFVDDRLRSVPVLEHGRLAGIVSRRDVLRALVRPDEALRDDLLRLVEEYTGDLDSWDVAVTEGMATIRRTRGAPDVSADVEDRALRTLAHTVGGVIGVRILHGADSTGGGQDPRGLDVDAPA